MSDPDKCYKCHKHHVDMIYKSHSYCIECFDKVTEEDFKKQTEIRAVKMLKDGG